MMFSDIWKVYNFDKITRHIEDIVPNEVERVLGQDRIGMENIHVLLSPAAEGFIEQMAVRAAEVTRERFGKAILIYAPLYLSNECSNSCLYCGFSSRNKDVVRRTLTMEETEAELKTISGMGIRHILLLTGEAPGKSSLEYIAGAIRCAGKYASFTGIEIYPLETEGYATLVEAGADGLTIYQETYDPVVYDAIHPRGRKKDMMWRLNAPDRGGLAGMRTLGVGPLLGLSNPRTDAWFAAMHAAYLMKTYWQSQVTLSFPRMRPAEGCAIAPQTVSDKMFVQFMTAVRLALPDVGFVVSTRETPQFRDNIVGLGVTQMSAASVTEPGGYTSRNISTAQFQVEDSRSVEEFNKMLSLKGYDPVMKDWDEGLKSSGQF